MATRYVVETVLDTKGYKRGTGEISAGSRSAAGGVGALTKQLLTLAGAYVGLRTIQGAIVDAKNYQAELTRIVTLVGINRKEVQSWDAQIKALGVSTGRVPQELAEAMFAVTSAGARGGEALSILEQSAKAAAVGLGDTRTVALAVTSAVKAYGAEGLTAAAATDVLVATIRAGNLEAASLAPTLGRVIGVAAQVGVSFAEVGGFVATLSRLGVSAEESITALRGTLSSLLGPTQMQQEALAQVNMTMDDLRRGIEEDGLAQTLVDLVGKFKGNEDALAAIIPNVRALAGILGVAGAQGKDFVQIQTDIQESLGITEEAFAALADDPAFKLQQLEARLAEVRIALGDQLMPTVVAAAEEITDFLGDADVRAFAHDWVVGLGSIIDWIGRLTQAVAKGISVDVPTSWRQMRARVAEIMAALVREVTSGFIEAASGIAVLLDTFGAHDWADAVLDSMLDLETSGVELSASLLAVAAEQRRLDEEAKRGASTMEDYADRTSAAAEASATLAQDLKRVPPPAAKAAKEMEDLAEAMAEVEAKTEAVAEGVKLLQAGGSVPLVEALVDAMIKVGRADPFDELVLELAEANLQLQAATNRLREHAAEAESVGEAYVRWEEAAGEIAAEQAKAAGGIDAIGDAWVTTGAELDAYVERVGMGTQQTLDYADIMTDAFSQIFTDLVRDGKVSWESLLEFLLRKWIDFLADKLAKFLVELAAEEAAAAGADIFGGGGSSNSGGGMGSIMGQFGGAGAASGSSAASGSGSSAASGSAAGGGTLATVGAMFATVAIFYAIWAIGEHQLSQAEKSEVAMWATVDAMAGTAEAIGQTAEQSRAMTALANELKSIYSDIETAVGGTITSMDQVRIEVQNSGAIAAYVGATRMAFESMEEAVDWIIRTSIAAAEFAGVSQTMGELLASADAFANVDEFLSLVDRLAAVENRDLNPVTAAIGQLRAELNALEADLKAAGVATVDLSGALIDGYKDQRDQILGIQKDEHQQRVEDAKALNREIDAEIRRLNQEIEALFAEAASLMVGDFWDGAVSAIVDGTMTVAEAFAIAGETMTAQQQAILEGAASLQDQIAEFESLRIDLDDIPKRTGGGKSQRKQDLERLQDILTSEQFALALQSMTALEGAMAEVNAKWDEHLALAHGDADLMAQVNALREQEIALLQEQAASAFYDRLAEFGSSGGGPLSAVAEQADALREELLALHESGAITEEQMAALGEEIDQSLGENIARIVEEGLRDVEDQFQSLFDEVEGISTFERQLLDLEAQFEAARQKVAELVGGTAAYVEQMEKLDAAQSLASQKIAIDFIGSLKELGVSLPIELTLKLAQAQFELAKAQAIAGLIALQMAGLVSNMGAAAADAVITAEEWADLMEQVANLEFDPSSITGGTVPPDDDFNDAIDDSTDALEEEARAREAALRLLEKWRRSALPDFINSLNELNADFAEIRRELGNTAEVQRVYQDALLQIVRDALADVRDLREELLFGDDTSPLSQQEQFAAAMAEVSNVYGDILRGDFSRLEEFDDLIRQALEENPYAQGSQAYRDFVAQLDAMLSGVEGAAADFAGVDIDDVFDSALGLSTGELSDPIVRTQERTRREHGKYLDRIAGSTEWIARLLGGPERFSGEGGGDGERRGDGRLTGLLEDLTHEEALRLLRRIADAGEGTHDKMERLEGLDRSRITRGVA